MKGRDPMDKLTDQERCNIISVCTDILRRNGWNAERSKQELKSSIEQTAEIKHKNKVYIWYANVLDAISLSVARKNAC